MNKPATIGIVILLVLGGGYIFLNRNTIYKSSTKDTSKTSQATTTNPSSSVIIAAKITYSDSGFSPSLTTVQSGDVVAITNSSSSDLQMQSNPHPAHTDDTDLNVGVVKAGATRNFTVTKTGTFGFHNHLNPTDNAKITIE